MTEIYDRTYNGLRSRYDKILSTIGAYLIPRLLAKEQNKNPRYKYIYI